MRDIALTLIVLGSVFMALRAPRIGVLAYVWLSVMNPHRLTFGFARDFRWALIVSLAIAIGLLFSKDFKWPPMSGLCRVLIAFFVWTALTTIFAVNFESSYDLWVRLVKTQIIVLLIPGLFNTKEQLRQLIWVIVLSVAYFGTKGGIFVLIGGGENRVYGPAGSYIEDNNYLAVATIMLIPMMRYLQITEPNRYVRWALIPVMALCSVSALGSYSRGGFIAIAAMGLVFWWKGKNKLLLMVAGLLLIPALLNFMPQQWHARMNSINTYEQDQSASMRLNSWATMFNIAASRITGAGFDAATRSLYDKYSPDLTKPPQVAHSIYFEVMGSHGFIGFGLYMLLYFLYWRCATALIRDTRHRPDLAWVQSFAKMSQAMMIGFLVGGAFLSLVNYDVPYYMIAIMIAVRALVDRELKVVPGGQAAVTEAMPRPTGKRPIRPGKWDGKLGNTTRHEVKKLPE